MIDAARMSLDVTESDKVQMILDYIHTSFNMHCALVDTKSLRSKTIYWGHRLLKENNEIGPRILQRYLKDQDLADHLQLPTGAKRQMALSFGDGGYSQVSWSHVEALVMLNHAYFQLNDLNLSLLWRMLVTTTQHAMGQDNRNIPWIGATIMCCRGAGLYTGMTTMQSTEKAAASNKALFYQALDKPNSAGGDYVTGQHAFFKKLDSMNSSQVRVFDIGQVPTDMTRYTEGGMRMFGTLLLDDKNKIRSEPVDNLFTQIYMNELQVSNIEQVRVEKFYSKFVHLLHTHRCSGGCMLGRMLDRQNTFCIGFIIMNKLFHVLQKILLLHTMFIQHILTVLKDQSASLQPFILRLIQRLV